MESELCRRKKLVLHLFGTFLISDLMFNLKWLKEKIHLLGGNWLSHRISGKTGQSRSEWEPREFKQLRTWPSLFLGTDAGTTTHISTVERHNICCASQQCASQHFDTATASVRVSLGPSSKVHSPAGEPLGWLILGHTPAVWFLFAFWNMYF